MLKRNYFSTRQDIYIYNVSAFRDQSILEYSQMFTSFNPMGSHFLLLFTTVHIL